MWRSPVAHLAGGQVVAGSNPVIPTKQQKIIFALAEMVFYIEDTSKCEFPDLQSSLMILNPKIF